MESKLLRVIQGYKHANYERTVELADFARQIITGEAYGELVFNYAPRETEEQKVQRVDISQVRTKAIAGKIEGFYKGAFRPDKLKLVIDHENESRATEINTFAASFGEDGQSLLNWSEQVALYYNNLDSNAFEWLKHSVEDGQDFFEPIMFDASCCLDYKIRKGGVEYFVGVIYEDIAYIKDDKPQNMTIPVYYFINSDTIEQAVIIDEDIAKYTTFYEQFQGQPREDIGEDSYYVITAIDDIARTPVSRVGYAYDKQTERKTYVPFWDNASEDYKILIQDGSAFDIALRLHTFPKLISMYTPCNYSDTSTSAICRDGYLHPSGETCPACNGTGKKYHTSGQDIIEIELPTADSPHVIKPSDIIHYADAPFDIVNKLNELVDRAAPKISEAVFSIDISFQHNGTKTATEIKNYRGTAQDVLFEFTKSPTKLFLFNLDIMARYLGITEGLNTDIVYSNQFDLESETELLTMLGMAKESGAAPEVVENINKRIVKKQNRTDSAYMNVYNSMRKFEPFGNIPKEIKAMIVAELPNSSLQKSLYLNFKEISEYIIANNPAFLMLSYDAQKAIIDELAQRFADQYSQDNSVTRLDDFRITDEEE